MNQHQQSLSNRNLAGLGLLLIVVTPTFANYSISRYSINNAGGQTQLINLQSARYEIKGNAGQVDASHALTGAEYQLNGGFWQQNTDLIFKDNLE